MIICVTEFVGVVGVIGSTLSPPELTVDRVDVVIVANGVVVFCVVVCGCVAVAAVAIVAGVVEEADVENEFG